MLFVRKYDPAIHHRRSIRLRGYDYSGAGRYFITICCQGHIHRFGAVKNGKMQLNDAGKMIEKWHLKIPSKFPDIKLGPYIIMPNHFHAIIIIMDSPKVRADPRVRPEYLHPENFRPEYLDTDIWGGHVDSAQPDSPQPDSLQPDSSQSDVISNSDRPSLSRVVQWFKTMTTNEYIRGVKNLGWDRFDGKLWQRNYYEHIIRNEKSYLAISKYIINNPVKWMDDKFHDQ